MGQINQLISPSQSIELPESGSVAVFFDSNKTIGFATASGFIPTDTIGSASYSTTADFTGKDSFVNQNVLALQTTATATSGNPFVISPTINSMPGGKNPPFGFPDVIGFQTGSNWFINYNYGSPYTGNQTEISLFSGSFLISWGFRSNTSGSYYRVDLQISSSTGWFSYGTQKYGDSAYTAAANGGNLNFGGGARIVDVVEATGSFVKLRFMNMSGVTMPPTFNAQIIKIKQT